MSRGLLRNLQVSQIWLENLVHDPARCIDRVRQLPERLCQDQLTSSRKRSDLDLMTAGGLFDRRQPEAVVDRSDIRHHRDLRALTGPSRLAVIRDAGDAQKLN
jgi:hypothetical protein